jgi:hypothetical protein
MDITLFTGHRIRVLSTAWLKMPKVVGSSGSPVLDSSQWFQNPPVERDRVNLVVLRTCVLNSQYTWQQTPTYCCHTEPGGQAFCQPQSWCSVPQWSLGEGICYQPREVWTPTMKPFIVGAPYYLNISVANVRTSYSPLALLMAFSHSDPEVRCPKMLWWDSHLVFQSPVQFSLKE